MTKHFSVVCILSVLCISSPLLNAVELQMDGVNSSTNTKRIIVVKDNKINISDVDGTTSASQLRARKSHAVSKQDELGLTVFFGLIVLAVIAFFFKPFNERK